MGQTPQIIENFHDFEPPRAFRETIDELVRGVPLKFLAGLQSIVLTNRLALNRDQRRRKTWSRNKRIRLSEALGYYSPATRSSSAFIVLYVDGITKAWDGWYTKLPVIRYIPTAQVLYHEIGHHIHAEHRPVYKGKEDVADDWCRKLWWGFARQRYWYLVPMFRCLSLIMRLRKWLRRLVKRPQHDGNGPLS